MSYAVLSIPPFDKQIKRLAKKYLSLESDFELFLNELAERPKFDIPLGKKCCKIRLAVASKGGGKSGGIRITINVAVVANQIYLLAIYDKGEKDTLSDKELIEFLKWVSE